MSQPLPLLGVGLPVSGGWATPEAITEVATTAERLGYASLWTFQRLLNPAGEDYGPPYRAVLDPLTCLGFAAAVTSRIRLGVAVVNLPYYAPIVLAKSLTTLDVLSNGRLDVGLGLGWAEPEFIAAGVPMARRGARAEEFLACLTAIWTQDEVRFDGEFYRVPAAVVRPHPVQRPHPPLLLGGTAEVALRRAGRLADGWISSSRADLSTIGESVALIGQAAAEAGRDPGALRFVTRGVVDLTDAPGGPDRRRLTGDVEQVRSDLVDLAAQGITEVFLDLNWHEPTVTAPDPGVGLATAHHLLAALAPAAA